MDHIIKTVAEMEQFIDENQDCSMYISADLNAHIGAMLSVPEKWGVNIPAGLIDAFFKAHSLLESMLIKNIKCVVYPEDPEEEIEK